MNALLLIATVGHNMTEGQSLGHAIFNAAVSHEAAEAAFNDAAAGKWSVDEPGHYARPPVTMAEFFEVNRHMRGKHVGTPEEIQATFDAIVNIVISQRG